MKKRELELAILHKIIKDKSGKTLTNLYTLGFDTTRFSATMEPYFVEIVDYMNEYNEMPPLSHVIKLSKELNDGRLILKFPSSKNKYAVGFYWKQLLTLKKVEHFHTMLNGLADYMEEGIDTENVDEILDMVETSVADIQAKNSHDKSSPQTLASLGTAVKAEYTAKRDGKSGGIPIPFKHLKDTIGHWSPGDLIFVLARTNVGKTWWVMVCALHAMKHGSKVFFASFEMQRDTMARRLFAIASKLPYDKVASSTLSEKQEKKYFAFIDEYKLADNMIISWPGQFSSPRVLLKYAADQGVQLVVVDSYYLLPQTSKGPNWEHIKFLTGAFKYGALEHDVAVLLTHQFGRGAKSVKSANEYNVAGHDSVNTDADYRIDLIQPKKLEKLKQLYMIIGKGRESDKGEMARYNWNVIDMDFSFQGIVEINWEDEEDDDTSDSKPNWANRK